VQQDLATGQPTLDLNRVDAALRRASHSLSNRFAEAKSLPYRLVSSDRLFTPIPDPDIPVNPLKKWVQPRHRVVQQKELQPLLNAWSHAADLCRASHVALLPTAPPDRGPVPALDGPSFI
jgi:hypothetical protein